MQHWYVYHSDKTMGELYKLSNKASFYLQKVRAGGATLFKKDVVWVIEGDKSSPCQFKLADCFIYSELKEPPFKSSHSQFKYNILGTSLLENQIILDKKYEWFNQLHQEYIADRKFFYPLRNTMIEGLKELSKLNFSNLIKKPAHRV